MSSFWNFFSDKKENESPSNEEQTPGQDAPTPDQVPAPGKPEVQTVKAPEPPPKPKSMPAPSKPRYGIDDAIKLMRTLPVDENVDLVVRVIKKTLESLAVRVPEIVEDAAKRQEALRTKITDHKSAIVQLEREIDARRFEIARLEEDLAETTQVRERLQLAEATAMSVTPNPPKTSNAPSPLKADAAKRGEVQRSAPPLPARPKPTAPDAPISGVKKPTEPASPTTISSSSSEEEEQPVESKDLVDKG